ncbi:hypothetical protein WA026_004287 [Henosepilachna vigintioctopunctata]|uniref:Uncharacterized protein n=1 Tax=Henosepilachna vigintioctopunctata TaxID=420089 RepID=A0AAW1V6H5_9CUCU
MSKSSSGKTPAFLHVPMEKRSETEASEMDLRMLRMENSYLKTLVEDLKNRNDRKNVNSNRVQASKSNTVKLATVSDSVVSALPMRPRQNVRDISSENINIHNLNKRAGDPERIHELKPSDLTENDEMIMSQEKRENLLQNEWTEIKSRRNKSLLSKGIICKGTTSSFSGVPQKRWIYVGRISGKNVEESVIKEYVRVGLDSDLVEVKKLVSKGINSSFSVGVPSEDMYQKIMNEEFWRNGVLIRDFSFENFFHKNSIVQQKRTQNGSGKRAMTSGAADATAARRAGAVARSRVDEIRIHDRPGAHAADNCRIPSGEGRARIRRREKRSSRTGKCGAECSYRNISRATKAG